MEKIFVIAPVKNIDGKTYFNLSEATFWDTDDKARVYFEETLRTSPIGIDVFEIDLSKVGQYKLSPAQIIKLLEEQERLEDFFYVWIRTNWNDKIGKLKKAILEFYGLDEMIEFLFTLSPTYKILDQLTDYGNYSVEFKDGRIVIDTQIDEKLFKEFIRKCLELPDEGWCDIFQLLFETPNIDEINQIIEFLELEEPLNNYMENRNKHD